MSMMEFNAQNYYLVVGEGGEPVIENEKLVLQNINDNNIYYADITPELLAEFGIARGEDDILPGPSKDSNVSETCSFSWTHKATLLFLEEYKKRHAKFRDPKHKKKLLWGEIAKEMELRGYDVNGDILDRKMRNMKHTYKNIIDNNNKKKSTGKGRIDWEYFNIFNDIFCEDKSIHVSSICMSSIPSATAGNSNLLKSIENLNEMQTENITNLNEEENTSSTVPSTAPSTSGTGKSLKKEREKSLNILRKRQLAIEEARLEELKKIRICIEESNVIQQRKLEVLKELGKGPNTAL